MRFNKWCSDNGVIAPSCEYPVVFGDGLIGVGAKHPIGGLKAFLFVPNEFLITPEVVKNSEIGFVLEENPVLFVEHLNKDYFTLISFLLFE